MKRNREARKQNVTGIDRCSNPYVELNPGMGAVGWERRQLGEGVGNVVELERVDAWGSSEIANEQVMHCRRGKRNGAQEKNHCRATIHLRPIHRSHGWH